jgi:hypothetical protein
MEELTIRTINNNFVDALSGLGGAEAVFFKTNYTQLEDMAARIVVAVVYECRELRTVKAAKLI